MQQKIQKRSTATVTSYPIMLAQDGSKRKCTNLPWLISWANSVGNFALTIVSPKGKTGSKDGTVIILSHSFLESLLM